MKSDACDTSSNCFCKHVAGYRNVVWRHLRRVLSKSGLDNIAAVPSPASDSPKRIMYEHAVFHATINTALDTAIASRDFAHPSCTLFDENMTVPGPRPP